MTPGHTLTHHHDIQAWVTDRHGMPAIVPGRNGRGECETQLALRFVARNQVAGAPDLGASPISWAAWFAELDRQQLVLRVSGDAEAGYELVARRSLN